MSNTNGKSELTPLTLPTSGEVVLIRPISPLVMMKFKRVQDRDAPKAPVQQTDLGPIANYDHPSYLAAMQEWQEEKAYRFNTFLIAEGAEIEWTDAKRHKLEAARERAKRSGAPISEDDTLAYVENIAIQSSQDMQVLLQTLTGQTIPTKEVVEETIATFQPDLAEQAAI